MPESKLEDRFGNSQEKIIVYFLRRKGYEYEIVRETCKEEILGLDITLINSTLNTYDPSHLLTGEKAKEEPKKILERLPLTGEEYIKESCRKLERYNPFYHI